MGRTRRADAGAALPDGSQQYIPHSSRRISAELPTLVREAGSSSTGTVRPSSSTPRMPMFGTSS